MITLITGKPGNAKTLYALNYVKALAEKSGRKVYQSGIDQLTLPWELFGGPGPDADKSHLTDASEWYKLPRGSIIVIDEAQRLFRPRPQGSVVPQYVAELETHRHQGLDIILITQHPMLVDTNVRRLVGQHFHAVRKFGTQYSTLHEWSAVKEQISPGALEDAVKHEFRYPKEAYAWYKSAEVHTVKRRIPLRVWLLFSAPLIVGGLVWFAYSRLAHYMDKPAAAAGGLAEGAKPALLPAKGGAAATKGPQTAEEYALAFVPRVKGLPHSAPVYDEVTKITRAPVPVGCVASSTRCSCASQDATPIAMDDDMCRAIVRQGYFVAFNVAGSGVYPQQLPGSSSLLSRDQLRPAAGPGGTPSGGAPGPMPSAGGEARSPVALSSGPQGSAGTLPPLPASLYGRGGREAPADGQAGQQQGGTLTAPLQAR